MTDDEAANYFAMQLLMPTEFLLEDLNDPDFDFLNDTKMKKLADKYQVSVSMICYRITEIKKEHKLKIKGKI